MQKQLRSFLTGNLINLSVALAGLILLVFGLTLGQNAWQSTRDISHTKRINGVVDALLAAADAQARERGLTSALIGSRSPGQIPDELAALRAEVDANWQHVNTQLEMVATELAENGPNAIAARTRELQPALDAFAEIRARVDRQLTSGGEQVSMKRWFEATTELNARAAALRLELMLATGAPDELMRINLLIRENAARLAENAGQLRGLLAYYAASGEPMPDDQLEMAHFAYRLAHSNRSELMVSTSELDGYPPLAQQLASLDGQTSDPGAQMLAAAVSGDYPLTADQWYQVTTRRINQIFALISTASAMAIEHLRERAHQNQVKLLIYLLLAAIAVALAMLSLRRVHTNAELLFFENEMRETILQSVADAVIAVDENGLIRYLNPIAQDLTGWTLAEAQGQHYSKVFQLYNRLHTSMTDPIATCIEHNMVIVLSEGHVLINREGAETAIDDSCAPIRNANGELGGAVVVFSSKERERNSDRILTYHATRDALTDLYNRRAFERQLRELIEHARTTGDCHTLAFIDLDNFKAVNDTGGHTAGDQMLRQIAFLMRRHVRDTDVLARLGGDEFGLLLKKCNGKQAFHVVGKLLEAVRELRFPWNGNTFQVGMSVGLVEIAEDSPVPDEVVREADAACYAAKEKGRNHIQLYSPENTELTRRQGQMQWVSRITEALDENRFVLFCQEVRPLKKHLPPHLELLLRMRDRDGELIPPNAFIPAAERHGIMPDIDRWVVESVSRKIGPLLQREPKLIININLSGTTLSDPDATDHLTDIIRQHGIPPARICFEVTETAAVANLETTAALMQHLRHQGFHFALDDFGAGLSSLTYLKNLPVEMVKIDGTFVRRLPDDPVAAAMIEAIGNIAGLMEICTCAEFVENETILDRLRELNIDYGQGYFFGRPFPLSEWSKSPKELVSPE
ncbi:EAL domain-containing protein [Thiohalomonas denitrificans]|uniref:PAS domain S-box-containing protein/diguanylate cyclase (GGDEF) domain-containing protein n=1 Tax=Thiohalomonas denitrificans TaxID=415747 RepID=A0A1G5PI43_9GAMM|nr:EAL domain-containing protein [Thiohalomonas denitrificans]SCZ49058.1 PAS domain S-box-containing protein/diguanylate cyclase (GGDEF) domain-containing protein [Thiohalomonas denitrificans]